MLLIIFVSILSSIKLLSNVTNILALTPPRQPKTLNDRRLSVLYYLIHFIAANSLSINRSNVSYEYRNYDITSLTVQVRSEFIFATGPLF